MSGGYLNPKKCFYPLYALDVERVGEQSPDFVGMVGQWSAFITANVR